MSAFVVDEQHIRFLVEAARCLPGHRETFSYYWPGNGGRRYLYDGSGYRPPEPHITTTDLGRILWKENFRSVAHRYPGEAELPGERVRDLPQDVADITPAGYVSYRHRPNLYATAARFQPGQVFSAIDCLDYQSCECEDWRETEAFAILEALRHLACRKVKGYGEPVRWDIREDLVGSSGNAVSLSSLMAGGGA